MKKEPENSAGKDIEEEFENQHSEEDDEFLEDFYGDDY